jgi:hypothetical protein
VIVFAGDPVGKFGDPGLRFGDGDGLHKDQYKDRSQLWPVKRPR